MQSTMNSLALTTLALDELETVAGGAFFVDGECIAGCGNGQHRHSPGPAGGVTAEEIWAEQLKKKKHY